jgi:hypothetical protein
LRLRDRYTKPVRPMGLKRARENDITNMSPAGTAELSPGRSPGLACATEKSRRDDWKAYRDVILDSSRESGVLNRENILIETSLGLPPLTFSRPYGTTGNYQEISKYSAIENSHPLPEFRTISRYLFQSSLRDFFVIQATQDCVLG